MQLDVGSEPTLRFTYVKCITYHNLKFGKVYTLIQFIYSVVIITLVHVIANRMLTQIIFLTVY